MQINKQLTKQYMGFIKQADFEYSKDKIGYYFDNGIKKFSIMQSGPLFNCFYNKKNDNNEYVLVDKRIGEFEFSNCCAWILSHIQKGD